MLIQRTKNTDTRRIRSGTRRDVAGAGAAHQKPTPGSTEGVGPFTRRSPTGKTGDGTQSKAEGLRLTGEKHEHLLRGDENSYFDRLGVSCQNSSNCSECKCGLDFGASCTHAARAQAGTKQVRGRCPGEWAQAGSTARGRTHAREAGPPPLRLPPAPSGSLRLRSARRAPPPPGPPLPPPRRSRCVGNRNG